MKNLFAPLESIVLIDSPIANKYSTWARFTNKMEKQTACDGAEKYGKKGS